MKESRHTAPPKWADRILQWYCSDYYLEEVQGDLHEWYYSQIQHSRRFLKTRYVFQLVRYYSFTRSKSFQKLITNPNYLSMKNILLITYRNLKKDKISATMRLLNLAFGISVFLLALVYANYELNYDQYHEKGNSIYRIGQDHGEGRPWAAGPIGLGPYLTENVSDVKSMVRFVPARDTWVKVGENKVVEKRVFFADSAALSMFSYEMVQGNSKTALKDPKSIVLTESMAKKYFGDADPMGKVIELQADRGSQNKTVTGVIKDVPAQSHLQFDFLCSIYSYGNKKYQRRWRNYMVYTFIEAEEASLNNIQKLVRSEFIERYNGEEDDPFTTVLTPLKKIHLYTNQEKDNADHGNIYYIYILFSIGTFVLIISCINFINLTIIKGLDRAKEVGLRKTVGAFRHQLIVQFMSENMVLLLFAGICSAIVLAIAAPFFRELSGLQLPLNFISNPQILLPLLYILIGLELISGVYPAVVLSRFKPAEIIKSGGSTSLSLRKIGLTRKALIITQFSLSVILVIGSVIVYSQLNYLKDRDLGFAKEQVLLLEINRSMRGNLEAFKEKLATISGVVRVSISSDVPGYRISMESVRLLADSESHRSRILEVDEKFLDTYKIDLISGENFSLNNPDQAEFIINETLATMAFGSRNPLNQQLAWADTGIVVGVVKDFNFKSLHTEVEPISLIRNLDLNHGYLSIQFNPRSTESVLAGLEQTGREIYPDLPKLESEFLDDRFGQLYLAEDRLQTIVWFFCLITILLTVSGIFGVASYNAHKRSKEIAIRKVLGAGSSEMIWQLLKGFVVLLGSALFIGLPGAYFLADWWLQDFAYQVTINPLIFASAAIGMLILIVASSGMVTFKATQTNPATTLKSE